MGTSPLPSTTHLSHSKWEGGLWGKLWQLLARTTISHRRQHAIELLLVKLAQLVADFPEIREIDLNPVLADETPPAIRSAPMGPAAERGAAAVVRR
jgi:ATP-grasp domain